MTAKRTSGRIRLTVSVPAETVERLRHQAHEHGRSVACEGGQLIRLGLDVRLGGASRSGAGDTSSGAAQT